MLERLQDLPAGIDGLKGVGKISREDYDRVAQPLFEEARREGRRMRFLYQLGPECEGFTAGGAWEDAKLGLRSLRLLDGCAVVTDKGWVREATRLARFLVPCPVRVFHDGEREQAIEWLRSLPPVAVPHRVVEETGVMVVEVSAPLGAHDFDALAATADAWIELHGDLRGLVVHARAFPGWENLEGLTRHVRFVRAHHRSIRRVALATDSLLGGLAPRLAGPFVDAEIRRFGFDELARATAWAAGAPAAESDA